VLVCNFGASLDVAWNGLATEKEEACKNRDMGRSADTICISLSSSGGPALCGDGWEHHCRDVQRCPSEDSGVDTCSLMHLSELLMDNLNEESIVGSTSARYRVDKGTGIM
jgi:hypothetical protein